MKKRPITKVKNENDISGEENNSSNKKESIEDRICAMLEAPSFVSSTSSKNISPINTINTLEDFIKYKEEKESKDVITRDKINKLKIGQEIRNYKELCSLLGIKEKVANSKAAQIKELSRYIQLERKGQKFIVLDIYKEPLEKADERLSIFTKCIEVILMYNFAHPDLDPNFLMAKRNSGEEGCYDFYKSMLWQSLGMINSNYGILLNSSRVKDADTDEYVDVFKKGHPSVSEQILTLFYSATNRRLTQILERALNSMKSRFILEWHYQTVIQYKGNVPGTNEKAVFRRIATPAETKTILNIQNGIMINQFNCNNVFQLSARGKVNEFYDAVNKELYKQFGWDRTFRQIRIISSQAAALRTYPIIANDFLRENKYRLNNEIAKTLITEAKNTYNKSLEKLDQYYKEQERKEQERKEQERKEQCNLLTRTDENITNDTQVFWQVVCSKVGDGLSNEDTSYTEDNAFDKAIDEANNCLSDKLAPLSKRPYKYPETYIAATQILVNEIIRLEKNSSLSDELYYDSRANIMDVNLIDNII